MRKLLRDVRGTAAFATVVALVPMIGVVALGGEAGSWYVIKQHAQNAADAAALAGGWQLKCMGGTPPCTQTVDYRAKQFAAQNAFCNPGDLSYPGSKCSSPSAGVSQSVGVVSGANQVTATVGQQQPAYLAAVLGLSTVNISATAVAQIKDFTKPCVLALNGSISFQGSPTLTSATCGVSSNSTADNAFDYKGNGGINVTAPSVTAGGCSQTGGSQCSNVITRSAPVPNPLSGLDPAMSSLKTSSFTGKACAGLQAYTAGNPCYNSGKVSLDGVLNGTYYFSGDVTIGGSATVTGNATLVFFGNASSLTINGNPTIQLTAQTSPSVPAALSAVSDLMKGLLIYDPEAPKNGVKVTGSANSYFNGTVYIPNSLVTYSGNSAASAPVNGCFQVIASAITFSGNTKLDDSGCPNGTPKPLVQIVALVQ